MEISILFWITYVIGVMVAMILFIDDAYEESWKHGTTPSDYMEQKGVIEGIILSSIGSWLAILYRWQKKR